MRVNVRVPATSANLGPGFDSFGLALDLWNEVVVEVADAHAVMWEGEGAEELATDGNDMISRAMSHAADVAGGRLPTHTLHGLNRIPLERGLGSSSAAAVAGVAVALTLLAPEDELDLHEVFRIAAGFEGHPDNASPAVYGGFTIVYGSDGPPLRLDPHPSIVPILLVPEDIRLPTEAARRALAQEVTLADAIFNASHAAGLVVALTTGDQRALLETLDDRLHQQARLALVPEVAEVFAAVRGAGVPVCVSGAGPSLLAFASDVDVPDPGKGWRMLRPAIAPTGVDVSVTA